MHGGLGHGSRCAQVPSLRMFMGAGHTLLPGQLIKMDIKKQRVVLQPSYQGACTGVLIGGRHYRPCRLQCAQAPPHVLVGAGLFLLLRHGRLRRETKLLLPTMVAALPDTPEALSGLLQASALQSMDARAIPGVVVGAAGCVTGWHCWHLHASAGSSPCHVEWVGWGRLEGRCWSRLPGTRTYLAPLLALWPWRQAC
jgi:hypothetical protein